MPQAFRKFASAALVLCFTGSMADARINVRGKLPVARCTKTNVCAVKVGNLVFTDGDNYVATYLNNFELSVLRNPATLLGPTTTWVVNFDQYNKTEDFPAGFESIYIRFLDKYGNYLPQTGSFLIDRNLCRDLGHKTASGSFTDDIFKRGARYYEITQQTLSANLGGC